ncbi:MAG: hypothetical protein HY580_02105, partial [Nitrospinae bacterium]|nr:hypothetical protein [Nitrospinota bacterium]
MINLYLWNRNQAEKYRKTLSEKIDRLLSPGEFPGNPATDLQKFYLDYKNRAVQFVNETTESHRQELRNSENAHLLLLKQTAMVDVVIQASLRTAVWLYNKTHSLNLREQDVPIAIVARGGYGREEIYFCSDVDIQLVSKALPQGKTRETVGEIVNYFEYLFIHQDIFRTASSFSYSEMDETDLKFDAKKMAAFYSLMEHRLVAGDAQVYNEFKSSIKTAALFHKEEIVAHFLQSKTCYDVQNTVFQQEPNVKDELRRLYWALSLARWRHSLEKNNQFELLQELFSQDKLSAPAFKNLQNALNFLSRVRLFLHCHQKGYQRDLLSYEVREKIAESMGFELKRFFHEYFYNAAYPMKRYSRNLFWESVTFDEQSVKNLHEDFAVTADNQIVCQKNPEETIAAQPELIFKILSWVAEEGCYPSYPIIRAIENNVDQMCPIFLAGEKSGEVRSYFKAIVEGKYFSRALRLLHEFGLLAHYYIPEFKNLCGLLQDIYVHLFPTDVHVLSALDELNKLELNKDIDPFLRELYESVKDKTALKLSVLLHDIGKGIKKAGEDEEMAGSRAIPRILENLGYGDDPRRIQDVAFLVERHLTLRDLLLLDPDQDDTYEMIWDLVYHDKERLKMLSLLTYSDRGGTKMKMSASQIEQLKLFYQNTLHHKKRSSAGNAVKLEFLDMIRLPRDLQMQLEIYNEF